MKNKLTAEMLGGPGSKKRIIGEMAEKGMTKMQVYTVLVALVIQQVKPWIFKANAGVGTPRIAKSIPEQKQMLREEIGRTFSMLGKSVSADFDSEEIIESVPASSVPPADETEMDEMDETEPEENVIAGSEETEIVPPVIVAPQPVIKVATQTVVDEIAYFVRRVGEIRTFCELREESTPIDDIGNRPVWAANRLIPAGIPADALLAAMLLHWPKDTRNEVGVRDYDFRALSRQINAEMGIETVTRKFDGKVMPVHEMFGYVVTFCKAGVPVWLYGGKGTGKSTLARQVADHLDIPYGETAMSAGATRGDLLGKMTPSSDRPFIVSKFCEIYGSGGVFNFEEIDAALPEVLIALNNALASDAGFSNPQNGLDYAKHPDFVAIATGNTIGLGANNMYVARERLDAATLDRWGMGRVKIYHDPAVERAIAFDGFQVPSGF
jgi:hypothetical protein